MRLSHSENHSATILATRSPGEVGPGMQHTRLDKTTVQRVAAVTLQTVPLHTNLRIECRRSGG